MHYFKLIVALVFCPFFLYGQNIIPNPSFEDTISGNFGLKYAAEWTFPTISQPEYYSAHQNQKRPEWGVPSNYNGFQFAKTGDAYIGLIIYNFYNNNVKRIRDYVQTNFINTLSKDSTYCLQLYVSLADSFRYASRNQLGVFFSNSKVNLNTNFDLPYTPQIIVSPTEYISEKTSWLKYNFQYNANGGEKYLIIGNFNDTLKMDTLLVGGGRKEELPYKGTYYYIDDVYLGSCDSVPLDTPTSIAKNSLLSKLKGYPNPVKGQFTLENNSKLPLTFQLYNLQGSKIQVATQQSNKKYSFSMGHLPEGVYLLTIIAEGERATLKIIKD